MQIVLSTFKGQHISSTTYPTKAEFVATMAQLYGDRVEYRNFQGVAKPIEDLSSGQLWIDGKYVGFWGN